MTSIEHISGLAVPKRGGYWGAVSASIDWCERNYAISHYVAEFWNTVSGIPLLILSLFGFYLSVKDGLEKRLALAHLFMGAVFIGTMCFHATLLYSAQLLDELPMIYGCTVVMYTLFGLNDKTNSSNVKRIIALVVLSISGTTWMVLYRHSPLPLQITYGALNGVLAIRAAWIEMYFPTKSTKSRKLLIVTAITYLTGFGCWLLDRHACHHVIEFNLHAAWHILSGAGTYLFLQFSTFHRLAALNRSPKITLLYGVLPVVRPNDRDIHQD